MPDRSLPQVPLLLSNLLLHRREAAGRALPHVHDVVAPDEDLAERARELAVDVLLGVSELDLRA